MPNGKSASAYICPESKPGMIETKGIKEIKIDYDYRATVLALNQAKITKDLHFSHGIEFFLQPGATATNRAPCISQYLRDGS
jgi:hypothetical protein